MESVDNARAAAVKVYEIIERYPVIDVTSDKGKKLQSVQGVIEFKDIHFRYPARPDVEVKRMIFLFSSTCLMLYDVKMAIIANLLNFFFHVGQAP
jgi:hypothetical protein